MGSLRDPAASANGLTYICHIPANGPGSHSQWLEIEEHCHAAD